MCEQKKNANLGALQTAAYKKADGKKIDGRRVVVDVERGRTIKGWKPRRLGGGKGGRKSHLDPLGAAAAALADSATPPTTQLERGDRDRHHAADSSGRDRDRDRDRDTSRRERDARPPRSRSRSRDNNRDTNRDNRRKRSKSKGLLWLCLVCILSL